MPIENAGTIRGTTVIAVRKNGNVAMAGDGQVTMGATVMKSNARKIRKIFDGKILVGFRRRHGGCLHSLRALRGEGEGVRGGHHAGGRGAGQGLAY